MRLAKQSDIEIVHEIYSHESVSPNMGFDPCSLEEFSEIYEELRSGGDLIVGTENGRVYAVCKIVRRKRRLRHSVYLGALALNSSDQGKGRGTVFFESVLDKVKSEGFSRIELLVASDNKRAISFFKKFGFHHEGTHKSYFSREGSDELFNEHSMAWVYGT